MTVYHVELNDEQRELRARQDRFDYNLEQLGRLFALPVSDVDEQHEMAECLCSQLANAVEKIPGDVAVHILGRAFVIVKDRDPVIAKKIVAEVTNTHGYSAAILTADM